MNGFEEFLTWLTGADGGAFLLVAWVVAWGIEGAAWWHAWTPQARSLAILVVAVAVGLVARWILTLPALLAVIDPYFRVVMYVVVAWLATQTAHRLNSLRAADSADKG